MKYIIISDKGYKEGFESLEVAKERLVNILNSEESYKYRGDEDRIYTLYKILDNERKDEYVNISVVEWNRLKYEDRKELISKIGRKIQNEKNENIV